jgi:hypothetical protein
MNISMAETNLWLEFAVPIGVGSGGNFRIWRSSGFVEDSDNDWELLVDWPNGHSKLDLMTVRNLLRDENLTHPIDGTIEYGFYEMYYSGLLLNQLQIGDVLMVAAEAAQAPTAYNGSIPYYGESNTGSYTRIHLTEDHIGREIVNFTTSIMVNASFNVTGHNFEPNSEWFVMLNHPEEMIVNLGKVTTNIQGSWLLEDCIITSNDYLVPVNPLIFQIVENVTGPASVYLVVVEYLNHKVYPSVQPITLGSTFGLNGQYFFPGLRYNFSIIRENEDLFLGSVVANEYGNISLTSMLDTGYQLEILDGCIQIIINSSLDWVWENVYNKPIRMIPFHQPILSTESPSLMKAQYFNITGKYFAPNREYDLLVKMRDVEDLYLGSSTSNENGEILLHNVVIITDDSPKIENNQIQIYATESFSSQPGLYNFYFDYNITRDLWVYLDVGNRYIEGDVDFALFIVNDGEIRENSITGYIKINDVEVDVFNLDTLVSGWMYILNRTFPLTIGTHEIMAYVDTVINETYTWNNNHSVQITVEERKGAQIILNSKYNAFDSSINLDGRLSWSIETFNSFEEISIYYSNDTGLSWYYLDHFMTGLDGSYFYRWSDYRFDSYIFMAIWRSDQTNEVAVDYSSLHLLNEGTKPILISSNSTILSSDYDSNKKEIFTVIFGEDETNGYMEIFIKKNIVSSLKEIGVYLDDEEIEFTQTDVDDMWLLSFDYNHSIHTILIKIIAITPPPPPSPPPFIPPPPPKKNQL